MASPMPSPTRKSTPAFATPESALGSRNLIMAKKYSAGILLYRCGPGGLEVLLVHPGGPFWAKRDDQAWSIPKGEYPPEEDALAAARREFAEETGSEIHGHFTALRPLKQPSGKLVSAWAIAGEFDPASLNSNTFQMEWPPRSGQRQEFPEVDRAAWFDLVTARRKIVTGQVPFLDELVEMLAMQTN